MAKAASAKKKPAGDTPVKKAPASKVSAPVAVAKKATAVTKKAVQKVTAPTRANTTSKSTKSASAKPKEDTTTLLETFFCEELKDIYWAEKHLLKALAKMEKSATAPKLKKAFADHRKVTEGHVTRLETVFGIMGKKAQAKKCEAMAGITKEGDDIIDETEKGTETRDVGLIMAAQKVEHYEIATYGGLAELARTIGQQKAAAILEETLAEEKDADESLTQLAKRSINREANEETEENHDGIFDKVLNLFS